MSLTNTMENALARALFQKANVTGVVSGATGVANFYAALYTASPTDTATGAEAAYGPYARVAVARTTGGWTVTGNSVSPTANVDFPACTGGTTGVCTHFALLSAATGGTMYFWGTVTPNISVAVGVTPRLTTSSTVTFD